jgi:hypothetical protein
MGIYDEQQQIYRPTNPMLFDAPSSQARPVTDLPVGTPMTAYGYRVVGDGRWWFARTDDGRAGWLPESDPVTYNYTMTAFPWQPIAVNETGAVWQTCPGSPATRLVPYISGRVTPGDPNRIRAEPESGSVIGEIPAGATFYINDGPVCGPSNGLTWWNVRYNETVGWTAEGQGNTYWLEPVSIQ